MIFNERTAAILNFIVRVYRIEIACNLFPQHVARNCFNICPGAVVRAHTNAKPLF